MLSKPTKTLDRNKQPQTRQSRTGPPDYEADGLAAQPERTSQRLVARYLIILVLLMEINLRNLQINDD
jgi:hypothetical protein